MTKLWDLWVAYCDRIPYPPSERKFARDIGMSPTAFGNWENGINRLPDKHNLARFARQINMPYDRILDAALHDSGYLPEPIEEGGGVRAGSAAPRTEAGSGPRHKADAREGRRAKQDLEIFAEDVQLVEARRQLDEAKERSRLAAEEFAQWEAQYARAAREGTPALKKKRQEHDEATEAVPEDPTGMEPI